jgi:hypothetical protein
MVSTPKSISNTKQKLGKTEHNLNLYFVNSSKANKFTEVGLVHLDWIQKNLDQDVFEYMAKKDLDDAINIIFTNNKGSEKIPMTAWMMAHRLAHALGRNNSRQAQFYSYKQAGEGLIYGLNNLLQDYGLSNEMFSGSNSQIAHSYLDNKRDKQLALKNLAYNICTFKSARDKNIRDWFEVLNELFSQYIIEGSVRFNKAPQIISLGKIGKLFCKDIEEANRSLIILQNDMNYYFEQLCYEAYGKILVM